VSRKIYVFFSVLLLASILAGCGLLGTKTSTSGSGAAEVTPQIVVVTATPGADEKVVVVTATPEPVTPTPEFIIITATPENTAEATATTASGSTSSSSATPAIAMANTYMQDTRNMYVSWNADGDMEKGFQVVWSYTNNTPTFPQDSSTYVSDINSRVVTIQVEPGHDYYIRVCRFNSSSQCDLYSNTITVNSGKAVPTAVYYQPPSQWVPQQPYHPSNGTATATATSTSASDTEAAYINLYAIRSNVSGTAVVHWSASGTFPYGFIVLYSSASAYPTYGDYPFYTVSSSTARSATVSGGVGTTFYYRVCRLTSLGADSCSNVRSFKY
jgi:hypothetical protein